jgi:hypothetical protein
LPGETLKEYRPAVLSGGCGEGGELAVRRFSGVLAGVGIGAVAFAGGQAFAHGGGGDPSTAALKLPATAAHEAGVGIREVFGNQGYAASVGDTGGVVTPASSVAHCPRGMHVISGGWDSPDTTQDTVTISSNEQARNQGWLVVAEDMYRGSSSSSSPATGFGFRAVALCV